MLDLEGVDGRGLIALMLDLPNLGAIGNKSFKELPREAQDAFARILDYARDCMDFRSDAGASEMLGFGEGLQDLIDELAATGHELLVATRRAMVRAEAPGEDPGPVRELDILYLVAAPSGSAPGKVAVTRSFRYGLG